MISIGKDDNNKAVRIKGKVKACRIEYETKDRTNWRAVILAYDMQDAIDYIRKNVQGFDRYISTSVVAEVDAFDDEVFNDFFVRTSVVETTVKPKKEVKVSVEEAETPTDPIILCPWCQKEFKNTSTLGIHIKKFHIDK
jgi:hypothetical protein